MMEKMMNKRVEGVIQEGMVERREEEGLRRTESRD